MHVSESALHLDVHIALMTSQLLVHVMWAMEQICQNSI